MPPRMRDRIGKIEVETGHLVQMVNELLDLARIEGGGPLVLLDDVDLGRVASEAAERLRLFADRQGLRLVVDVRRAAAAGPRRRGAARPGRREPRPQRAEVRAAEDRATGDGDRATPATGRGPGLGPGDGDEVVAVGRGPRRRASRGPTRPGSSSASTRSTGSASGAAARASGWRSPAT